MENCGIIIWEDEIVGTVKNIVHDMWYLDADWELSSTEKAFKFSELASRLKAEDFFKGFSKGIAADLRFEDSFGSQQVLIISLEPSKIFMRLAVS